MPDEWLCNLLFVKRFAHAMVSHVHQPPEYASPDMVRLIRVLGTAVSLTRPWIDDENNH